MGSALTTMDAWRADVATGKRVGPRIIAAGAILDGAGHHSPERIPLATPEAARRVVDSLADAGAEFLKVYDYLQRDVYRAVIAEAGARKLSVVGHVPRDVGAIAAAEAGERSIEHFSGVPLPCPFSMRWAARTPGLSGMMPPCGDDGARAKVFDRFRATGTWVTPTLVSFRGAARATDASALGEAAEPRMRHVTPALRRHWDEQIAKWPKVVPASYRRGLTDVYGRVTRAAHGARVSMLAGSDLGNTLVFPGSSLHEELELLVANGLSPLEALQAPTSAPARFLGVADSLGTVAAGMVADLVLLDANPLDDIRNVRRIRAVVRAGALLDRDVLDRLAAERAPETDHP
jgi:imidazolonepropionase-like amidohydrolase